MSADQFDMPHAPGVSAAAVLVAAKRAAERAAVVRADTVADLLLPDEARLDERSRVFALQRLRAVLETLAARMTEEVAASANSHPSDVSAETLTSPDDVVASLLSSKALATSGAIEAIVTGVRLELIGLDLPVAAPGDGEDPSLLARLSHSSDRNVASAAVAMMAADANRRAMPDEASFAVGDLDAAVRGRLVWLVAAALRPRRQGSEHSALDRALTEAARRILDEEGDGPAQEAAFRLVEALDATDEELPVLLEEALDDRRTTLFAALMVRSLGIGYDEACDLIVSPPGDRLWVALRALDLPRSSLARMGYALSEALPGVDPERFAERFDALMKVAPGEARECIASPSLDTDYHDALRALEEIGANRC